MTKEKLFFPYQEQQCRARRGFVSEKARMVLAREKQMTIESALANFKRCADEAPEGTYVDAKALNEVIGDSCDDLIKAVRALGLKADTCDLIYQVEATIYDYVKRSNPESSMFAVSEGFGKGLDSPARDRVLPQTISDRDFLRSAGVAH